MRQTGQTPRGLASSGGASARQDHEEKIIPPIEDSLAAWLEPRRDAFVDDLKHLVAVESPSGDKEGLAEMAMWLEARMVALGAEVERRRGHEHGDTLIGRWPPADGGGDEGPNEGVSHVLLSGHADTVYPRGTAAERPLRPHPDHPERLVGPGSADMKGGLLTGLYAVAALRAVGAAPRGPITFVIGADEEVSSPESSLVLEELAPRCDIALVLEAARANGDVVTGRKGGAFWRLRVSGRAAHAGIEPERGASAFLQAARTALALDDATRDIPGVSLVIGTAHAGEAPNMVPPSAELTLDGRALDASGMQALADAVDRAVAASEGAVPGTSMHLEGGVSKAPLTRDERSLGIYRLASESAAVLGLQIGEQVTGGTSDANLLAAAGLPVLDGLGPVGGLPHSPDEYVDVSTLVPRTALLAGLIARINGLS